MRLWILNARCYLLAIALAAPLAAQTVVLYPEGSDTSAPLRGIGITSPYFPLFPPIPPYFPLFPRDHVPRCPPISRTRSSIWRAAEGIQSLAFLPV